MTSTEEICIRSQRISLLAIICYCIYVWRDERKRAKDEREPEITVDKIGCDDAAGRRKRRSESLFVVKEKGQHYIWERIYMQQAAISLKV